MEAVYANSSSAASANRDLEPLNQSDRAADVPQSLATAAHELKTPLAIMSGYLHLLMTQKLGPLTPKQIDVLSEIRENALRLTAFVQDLLTYASMHQERCEMQYEKADVNACVREIAELWSQRFHQKAIAFYFFPADRLASFRFDWLKVQHIVSNLLDNAIKYTPPRGTVWLHVEPYFWERRAGRQKIAIERRRSRSRSPNCCRISVCDTGPGVEPEYHQEIFDEYVRITCEGVRAEGHGLGLAIARKLVQVAGGKIWVESEPGHGSKFSFLLLLDPLGKGSKGRTP
jgi:signal transduction histidine kinase